MATKYLKRSYVYCANCGKKIGSHHVRTEYLGFPICMDCEGETIDML